MPPEHDDAKITDQRVENIWDLFDFKENLAIGKTGEIVLVSKRETDVLYALKMMDLRFNWLFTKQLKMMRRLESPHVVRFEGAYEDSGRQKQFICMEYLAGKTLLQSISERKSYTEGVASRVAKQMLQAVKYLHDKQIIHRDIRLENFMFLTQNSTAGLKLLEFGMAMDALPDEEYVYSSGTPYYMAPEIIRNEAPRSGTTCMKGDMWALGVCFFILLSGRPPFRGNGKNELFNNVLFQKKLNFQMSGISQDAKDMVFALLNRSPDERPTVDQALGNPWIVTGGKDVKEITHDTIAALRSLNFRNSIQQALERVAIRSVDEHEEKHIKQLFDRFDRNKDGYIGYNECVATLELDLMYREEAKRIAKEMIENSDYNKDNKISYDEFKRSIAIHSLTTNDAKIHAMFSVLDDNKDGYISLQQLIQCLHNEGVHDPKAVENIIRLFERADKNGDGRLEFADFLQILSVKQNLSDTLSMMEPGDLSTTKENNEYKVPEGEDAALVFVESDDEKI